MNNNKPIVCIECGEELSQEEREEFEDMCESCVFIQTGGLIDDKTEDELDI